MRTVRRAAALAAALFCFASLATAGTIEHQLDATCRITLSDGSSGTGAVISDDGRYIMVLTNAHVVGSARTCHCEFWARGYQSTKLVGQVFTVDREIDAATVVIPKAAFGAIPPKVLLWGTTAPPVGATIKSVGCAQGSWATAWQGHVRRYGNGHMAFVPPPANGRSGSAITDADGKLVGLLRARTLDSTEGIAVDLATLRARLNTQAKEAGGTFVADAQLVQWCSPNGPNGSARSIGRQPEPAPASPYPLMPLPAAPPVDLAPILNKLDRISDQISMQVATPLPPPTPSPVMPLGPDPQTLQAIQQIGSVLDQHDRAIEQLKADVPRAIESASKPLGQRIEAVGEAIEKVDRVVRPLIALREKLEEDAAEGGIRGRLAQRMLDRTEDPTQWIQHALKVIGISGAIAFGVILLLLIKHHANKTGRPTFLEQKVDDLKLRLQGAAVANPSVAPLAAGVTAVDAVYDRLNAKLDAALARLNPGAAQPSTAPVNVNVTPNHA